MEGQISPNIASFVIRFVQAESLLSPDSVSDDGLAYRGYRGTIRHIQSDEEIAFIHWADAIEFIRRFVQIEEG